jgi:hypothetical protein
MKRLKRDIARLAVTVTGTLVLALLAYFFLTTVFLTSTPYIRIHKFAVLILLGVWGMFIFLALAAMFLSNLVFAFKSLTSELNRQTIYEPAHLREPHQEFRTLAEEGNGKARPLRPVQDESLPARSAQSRGNGR